MSGLTHFGFVANLPARKPETLDDAYAALAELASQYVNEPAYGPEAAPERKGRRFHTFVYTAASHRYTCKGCSCSYVRGARPTSPFCS